MKKFLFAGILLLGVASCTQKTAPVAATPASNPTIDCRDVMCTMEFRTITVGVVDRDGKPVQLDSYQTTLAGTGTVVGNTGAMHASDKGEYPVVSDAYVGANKNTRTKVVFTGTKSGKTVVSETYEIGVDCCHVSKISGKEKVVAR